MFRFGRQSEKNAAAEPIGSDDPLAVAEEERFRLSILEAREKVRMRAAVQPAAAPTQEPEIVWDECSDVYRPGTVNGRAFVALLSLEQPVEWKQGRSYIFVRRDTLDRIQAHLHSDLSIELGGLLGGQAFWDAAMKSYFVVVEEAFPALGGIGTATRFEYTSASWQAITPNLHNMHPDWTVVGSYHSHPNVGVFLSQTDKDTQADVFSYEWQVALVIDPIREEVGFFMGEHGIPCPAWRIIS